MKKKEQNLTQAAFVLLLSTIVVKLIGAFFKIPLSADYALGDLGFGYFSAAYDVYIPIYTLALSGFPVAIARLVADYTAKERFSDSDRVFYISFKTLLVTGVTGFLMLCALAIPFVNLTDKSGQSLYSIWAIAPSVLFCSVASVYRGYFEGLKNMIPTAISNIIEALGKLILGLSFAIVVMRITANPALSAAAAMAGITLGTFASCLYLWFIHKKRSVNFIKNIDFNDGASVNEIFKKLVILAIPVAIASLSASVTSLIDALTLRTQLTTVISSNANNAEILLKDTLYSEVSTEEIPTLLYGIKGKCHTLFNLIPTLTTAFGVGALPLVTQCYVVGDKQNLKKNINLIIKYSSVISLPCTAGFIALGKKIIELLYGNTSAVLGGKILAIYGVAALFAGLTVPLTSLLQATEKQNKALFNIVLGMIFKLALNIVLTRIPTFNVYGAVIGTAVCYAVIFMLHIITLCSSLKILPDILNCFIKPAVAAILCGITAYFISVSVENRVGTVFSIAAAGLVYLSFLIILRGFSREEIEEFIKK